VGDSILCKGLPCRAVLGEWNVSNCTSIKIALDVWLDTVACANSSTQEAEPGACLSLGVWTHMGK
jgi:hypothetical protein